MSKSKRCNNIIISYSPTLCLKSVDVSKLYQEYINGKYNHITLADLPHIKLANDIKYNNISDVIVDSSGNVQRVLMTNSNPAKRCSWCLSDIEADPVGIPVDVYKSEDKLVILVDQPYYCTFECAYAGLYRENNQVYYLRDSLYKDSEWILKTWFSLIYPNKELRKAPDWRLLDINGGTLTIDEFRSNSHTLTRLPNFIIQPVKISYI